MGNRATATAQVELRNVRGANDWDSPSELDKDEVVSATNWRLQTLGLGRRRYGSGQFYNDNSLPGLQSLGFLRVQGQAEASQVNAVFGITTDATPKLFTAKPTNTTPGLTTITDAISSNPQQTTWCVVQNQMYACYKSALNRLHQVDAAGTWQRVGLALPAAPTVANTGAGAYAAVARFYRVQWRVVSGTGQRTAIRSNLGTASASFTPSGAGTAARVTQPAVPANESITHWVVYGSADGTLYYKLSGEIAIATTTYDDSAAPSAYNSNEAAPEEGTFTPWPSVKFLLNTGTRLVGFGCWETAAGDAMTPKDGRIFFSPVIGSTDTLDLERVSNTLTVKGYLDLGSAGEGDDRALVGPLDNQVYALKSRGIFRLTPTGDNTAPFLLNVITRTRGAVNQQSTFMGEDEAGRPCFYFLDEVRGPYRYGADGLQWLGYDIQRTWRRFNAQATTMPAHGVWDGVNGEATWWIALNGSNTPNGKITFRACNARPYRSGEMRGGWTSDGGRVAAAACSVVAFNKGQLALDTVFYGGIVTGFPSTKYLVYIDVDELTDDNGTNFDGVLTSRVFNFGTRINIKSTGQVYTQQEAFANGVSMKVKLIGDFGRVASTPITQASVPAGPETRRIIQYPGAELSNVTSIQVEITNPGGDIAHTSSAIIDWLTATFDVIGEIGNIS